MVFECDAYNDVRSSSGLCFKQEFTVLGHFLPCFLRLDISLLLYSSDEKLHDSNS